jgi:DNA-binding transcriptional LysR family regulator
VNAEQISRKIKLRQLNVLTAVVRFGSMAKAADELAVSQPVISKAISELEELLKVRLLNRGTYGVEPTAHGRALLKRCAGVFDELRASVSELEFLSSSDAGEVRIGCEEPLATGLLSTLVDQLSRSHPRLTFEIVVADRKTLRERDLPGRNVEIAIMRTTPLDHDDAEFDAKVLYDDHLQVVAGMTHPLAQREKKIALADLAGERWCLPPTDHPIGAMVLKAFRAEGLAPPPTSVLVSSAQHTSNLVAKGLFLGVHGLLFLHFVPSSIRLKVLCEVPDAASAISVVSLKGRSLTPPAEMFVNHTQEVVNQLTKELG